MSKSQGLENAVQIIAQKFKQLSESSVDSLLDEQGETHESTEAAAKELQEGPNSHFNRVSRALETVLKDKNAVNGSKLTQEIENAASLCQNQLKDSSVFINRMNENEKPQDILGFSDQSMKTMFEIGNAHLKQKDGEASSDIFWLICSLNPMMPDYWIALGRAEQLCKRYDQAIHAFSMSVLLDEDNPYPYFHAAQCSKDLGDEVEASLAIDYAIGIAVDDNDWSALLPELETFKKSLKK